MKAIFLSAVLILLAAFSYAQDNKVKWFLPLESGMAPECPENQGLRESRSGVAESPGGRWKLWIAGASVRNENGSCRQMTRLVIEHSGKIREITLQSVKRTRSELSRDSSDGFSPLHGFEIIDFSSDGRFALIQRTGADDLKNRQFRDVETALVDLSTASVPLG
jgi:hypothetical protein